MRARLVALSLVSVLAAAGCGGSSEVFDGPGGATGGQGSGGATGAGGTTSGTGGANGTAGASGTGGATGAGGATQDAGRDASSRADGADGASDRTNDAGTGGPGVVAAGVRWFGRIDATNAAQPRFSWSGNGFEARFSGTALSAQLTNTGAFIYKAVIDGQPQPTFVTTAGQGTYSVATGLAAGMHTVQLFRQTEGSQGDSQLLGLDVTGGGLMTPPLAPARLIEIVGDSISAGYGTLGMLSDADCFASESHWDTYGAVAARMLGADLSTIAMSGQGVYRNYGGDMTNTLPMVYARALTNDTSPSWDFRAQPQAVIIDLGTNDISNNKGDPGQPFLQAYVGLAQMVRARNPSALIVCIIGPLLGGTDLTTIRGYITTAVAMRRAAGDSNIEFFDMIATQTSDKAACAYHPNPAENQIMAGLLVTELRARLGW